MRKFIRYTEGWKYRLEESYQDSIPFRPPVGVKTQFVDLSSVGELLIRRGFAWDGPSGPAIDTKNFMRASLVHDALYGLMRSGHISAEMCRDRADVFLRKMCIEDGMSQVRAWWVYSAVKTFAGRATTPEGKNPVLTAP